MRGVDALSSVGAYRLAGIGYQLWSVGHWQCLEPRIRQGFSRGIEQGHRLRRKFHRHRRRIRRWAQRTPDRTTEKAAQRTNNRRHQSGPPAAKTDRSRIQPREPNNVDRRQSAQPRDRLARLVAAPLPTHFALRTLGSLRNTRRLGESRKDTLLRREPRKGRGSSSRHPTPECADGADHLYLLSPTPGGYLL